MLKILLYLIITITTILLSLAIYVKYAFLYWKRLNIPYLTPAFPYGNLRSVVKEEMNFGNAFTEFYERGKQITNKYIGVYSFTSPFVVLLDPNIIKSVLSKDFDHFSSRGLYYNEKVDPLNAHLANISGPKWRKMRSKCTPMFTSSKMKLLFKMLVELSKELDPILASSVAKSEPIDICDLMHKLMTNNIGSCTFGLNCNTFKDPNSAFRKYAMMYTDSTLSDSLKIMLSRKFPCIFDLFQIPMIRPEVTKFFMDIFNETVQSRIASKEVRRDFIDLFIRIQRDEDIESNDGNAIQDGFDGITFNELAAQAFVFFTQGLETSSSTLNVCLYELAANPDVQQNLRNEIIDVLKSHSGHMTYDAVVEMKYLDNVICEALRKYPPLPFLNRVCNKEYTAPDGKLVVKKGINVWIPTWAIQMDETYFPNPEKFDPNRFTDIEKAKRPPCTYLPFGDGPRICIGNLLGSPVSTRCPYGIQNIVNFPTNGEFSWMKLGMLQMKVAIIALLMKYRYTVNSKTTTPLKFSTRGLLLALQDNVYLDVHNY